MKVRLQRKKGAVNSIYKLPGDKSIGHRSLLIGALGKGEYKITNYPNNLDCLSTLECMKLLGVKVSVEKNNLFVNSPGYTDFKKDIPFLNANNSGTTARLISGLAAGANINCIIDGDASLKKRPMSRIISPLMEMGASINSKEGLLPIEICCCKSLSGISYELPVASAQVKSCLLIAGFLAQGETALTEKTATRDHTERMFNFLGADIKTCGNTITIKNSKISSRDLLIPGDISSAAFLVLCALLSDNSDIMLQNMLLNEGRKKYIDILKAMGGQIEYKVTEKRNNEEVGYIIAKSSILKGVKISKEEVPSIIDEIPVLAVAGAFAAGETIIEGIGELKYKESNRINAMGENLQNCGIHVSFNEDYMQICGENIYLNKDLYINSYNDHRIALAFAALGVRNLGSTIIDNWECTNISFPNAVEYYKDFINISCLL